MKADNDWKKRLGVVYSTDPSFNYSHSEAEAEDVPSLPKASQKLRVYLDRSGRAGKQVTLVKGFRGSAQELSDLARQLKVKCGVGGSVDGADIMVQGDLRDKVASVLVAMGYVQSKRGN